MSEAAKPQEYDFSDLERPKISLLGQDGNALTIVGRCMSAARRAGWPRQAREAFFKKATGGSYDAMLGLVHELFEVTDYDD